MKPQNIVVTQDGQNLDFLLYEEDDITKIKILFKKLNIGKSKKTNLKINFEDDRISTRTGEIWEVSIPKIKDLEIFRNYDLKLKIPKNFGEEAYITPEPKSVENHEKFFIYEYKKDDLELASINAAFGKFQVFTFDISYHLSNNTNKTNFTKIAIPPDTNSQRVYYNKISPSPLNIEFDEDGNWLALYKIKAKQKLEVNIFGSVQIFANPIKYLIPSPSSILTNLKPTDYWQSDNESISKLSKNFKIPKEIYDFVVDYLDYNYERIEPDAKRLGALEALKSPKNSLCTEFTDLFIALSRAAGIPAREINGFAYTENPKIEPLSLVSDVLHSWPEYWDSEKNLWIAVDPTWASTSGSDYFEKFDLRHFAFVIHGKESTYPLPPGSYKFSDDPKKDIFVSFGNLPNNLHPKLGIKINKKGLFNLLNQTLVINFINEGKVAIYDINPKVIIDSQEKVLDNIRILPPLSSSQTKLSFKTGLFGILSPQKITVQANNNEQTLFLDRTSIAVNQLILVSLLIILTLFFLNKRFHFLNFFQLITKK